MQQHWCYSSECSKLSFMCSSPVWNKVTAIKHTENNQSDSAMKHWQRKIKWQRSACHFNIPRTSRWMGTHASIKVCFQIMTNSFLRHLYLVSRRLNMQASLGERGLHANKEATVRRIISRRMRTRWSCSKWGRRGKINIQRIKWLYCIFCCLDDTNSLLNWHSTRFRSTSQGGGWCGAGRALRGRVAAGFCPQMRPDSQPLGHLDVVCWVDVIKHTAAGQLHLKRNTSTDQIRSLEHLHREWVHTHSHTHARAGKINICFDRKMKSLLWVTAQQGVWRL